MSGQYTPVAWMAPYPDAPDAAAYHGPLGELVRQLEGQTEADPVGILASAIVATGNAIGTQVATEVSGRVHHARIFALLIGPTAARKGTAQGVADTVLERALPVWSKTRRASGLSSGEGLIRAVRDETTATEQIRDPKTRKITGETQTIVTDAGVDDKRLLVVEEEFARALRSMAREGNTLSEVLRAAWDGKALSTLTREAQRATGAHISLAGHITPVELRQFLRSIDLANGLMNRFLLFAVRRSRLLPRATRLDPATIAYLADLFRGIFAEIKDAADGFDDGYRLDFDEPAWGIWERVYPLLSRQREGVLGGVLSRAESQVRRLALLYAALDLATSIGVPHLEAALAVWRYCEQTATGLFGTGTGDTVMDTILGALAEKPRTQTEISNLFGRNIPDLVDTLELMEDRGLIKRELVKTGGRPRTLWSLVVPGEA